MSESDLIRCARQRDLEAFNNLVLRYQDSVYRQAYWMLGDPQAADDVCQETFLRAYRKLGSFRDGSLRAWLLTIANRLCLDELRRSKRRPAVPLELVGEDGVEYTPPEWDVDPGPSPEEQAEESIRLQLIQGCLERLTPEWRLIITLVDLQGFDYAQTAEILAIPLGTVKSRLARARHQLGQALLASGALAELSGANPDNPAHLSYGLT
jgi:RNA polymerase sigma-70 factor (ECF subfamily)